MPDSKSKHYKKLYSELYAGLDDITPLQIDCGELCGSRCCSNEIGKGVFLFPYEEVMFENKMNWGGFFQLSGMDAIRCDGKCVRAERPLACRLFPLFPYLSADGKVETRFYSPMTAVCPLIRLGDYSLLAPDYADEVMQVTLRLFEDPDCQEFLLKISREIDAYESEPWSELLK
ncbi:hypothetical protein JXJ21_21640 [candidate division KSB1 bacterium]|nr:hypothetical protein [candidate division KSB1 bacterium]